MTTPHQRIARQNQARADITDVEQQVVDGEIDRATADELIARYRRELEALDQQLTTIDQPKSDRRRAVGVLLLVGILVVVATVAFQALQPRDDGFITGDLGGSVDLDTVTNDQMEAVIAANADLPEVAAMRIALADRYFDATEFPAALGHYLEALDGQLDSTRRARALARIGWMSFVSGEAEVAARYLDLALTTDPAYDEARLFLGLVRLDQCNSEAALDQLVPLVTNEEVPDDMRGDIQAAVDLAEAQIEAGTCQ